MTILKCIAVFLLLANVGLFLWFQGVVRSAEPSPTQAPGVLLKLASEAPTELASSAADATSARLSSVASGEGSADLVDNANRCVSVGPFRDVAEASHAASTLRARGYDPRQRVADGEVGAGVWIYLSIPPSQGASEQMLAKLKAAGVEDALEMPGPVDGPVISLGLYNETKRGQARIAQIQALGFKPIIADRKRTGNVYWIDVDLKSAGDTWNPADLLNQSGRIARWEVKACPAAAGVT